MDKAAAVVLKGAFLDELEKVAVSRHLMRVAQSRKGRRPMRVDTLLRKEKEGTLYKRTIAPAIEDPLDPKTAGVLDSARGALSRGVSNVAGAAERKGLSGAATALRASNAPIETGAMGHVVQDAGQRMQVPGRGNFTQGMGRALQHEGHVLSRGGAPAVARTFGKVLNPIGAVGEVAAAGAGNMAAKALKYAPGSRGDRILTHHLPKAFEYAAPAAMGMALHAPVGAAGLLGGKAMAAAGTVKPLAAAGAFAHGGLLKSVGHGAAEFAHHGLADVAGTRAQGLMSGVVSRASRMVPGRLAQAGAAA